MDVLDDVDSYKGGTTESAERFQSGSFQNLEKALQGL